MKKILASAVLIAVFLIMPSISSAQRVAFTDDELSAVSAGTIFNESVTVTYSDSITIPGSSTHLASTVTNFQDFWGHKVDANAYFGITDISVNDATFQRSGSITQGCTYTNNPSDPNPGIHTPWSNIPSLSMIRVSVDVSVSSSDVGLNQTLKLGTRSDLTTWNGSTRLPDQVLGQTYTGGISATVHAELAIYAQNRPWTP
jgi:hypothetical protein